MIRYRNGEMHRLINVYLSGGGWVTHWVSEMGQHFFEDLIPTYERNAERQRTDLKMLRTKESTRNGNQPI